MRRLSDELSVLPKEPASDSRFAELFLEICHTRRAAPISILWVDAKSGSLDRALEACALLCAPKRFTLLAALAAYFGNAKDGTSFDKVWSLLLRFASDAEVAGTLPDAALAQCVAYRPELIMELCRKFAGKWQSAFQILARVAPAETVAAAFSAVERSDLEVTLEQELNRPIAWGRRVELAHSCIPLITRTIRLPRGEDDWFVYEPSTRRDTLRSWAFQCLCQLQKFDEALQLLSTYEDVAEHAGRIASLHLQMGEPLKARDALVAAKVEQSITKYPRVCAALGIYGHVEAVLEVAEVSKRYFDRSFAARLVLEGCEQAIKHGYVDAVVAVLERVLPRRNREKLELLIGRAAKKAQPKSLRAQAATWVECTPQRMPEIIQRIQSALTEAKEKDRPFLLASLLRAQAKAKQKIDTTLVEAFQAVACIKMRAPRLDATADVAAAMVSVGMRDSALRLMDTTGEALEMGDKEEAREFVRLFVDACVALGAAHLLSNLTREEIENTGFGMFIEEHLTWQGAHAGEVDKLVARAKKTGDFRDAWEILRAERKFAEAAAVVRHAPKDQNLANNVGTLLEEAAEFRQLAVVLDLLETIGRPEPGEHAAGTPSLVLIGSYCFRAEHGLPGGTLEHLIHVLAEPFDFASPEFLKATEDFAEHGKFSQWREDPYSDGDRLIKERGSWEGALAHVDSIPRDAYDSPSKFLLSLARIAIRDSRPESDVSETLAECCERLDLHGFNSSVAREILVELAQWGMTGTSILGLPEKARSFLEFDENRTSRKHRIHLHAYFGEWQKSLSLLPYICSLKGVEASYPSSKEYPWRILLFIPLEILRSSAAESARDLPTAWMFVAALAWRSEPESKLAAKLPGQKDNARVQMIEMLQRSIAAIHHDSNPVTL